IFFFFFQAEDGIRYFHVTGVQTCALPICLNGSGKSSLLKIIAGLDKSYQGEVVFSPGYSVGYLAQEPILDPEKTVREIVEEGVAETTAILKEYEEINEKFEIGRAQRLNSSHVK